MEGEDHKRESSRRESCSQLNENKAANKTKVNKYKKGGSAGSKGTEYQISLIAVIMLNAMKNVLSEWKLSTENEAAGKFDDIVVEWTQGAVLLQSKHKENSKKRITLEELTSTNSRADDFSLPKYFLSYMSIRNKFDIKNLILCTNAVVHEKALEFLNHVPTNTGSLLHYENGECSFYTLKDTIIPVLKEKTNLYYDQNFKNKGISRSVITNENLSDFLTRLQLFFSYPSQTDLDKIIEQLLSLTRCCSNSQGQITQKEMYPKLMSWFQQKEGIYFTDFLAKAMFAEIWTDKYCEKLKLYKVSLQENSLNFQNSKQIFYVNCVHGNLLQAIRIYYAVQKKKLLFVNPDDDIDTQRLTLEAFSLPQYDFLTINQLKIVKQSVIKQICAKLRDVLSEKRYKKVILMSDDVFSRCLRHKIDYEIIDGSVTFADLTQDFQEELVKKKSIIFQGRAVCLEELLVGGSTKDYVKATSQEILENIITGKVKVGVQPSDVDEDIAPFYINRTFMTPTGNIHEKDIYDVKDDVVLISNNAGVGKTTVLSNLAINIKDKNPHLWVINIALLEYTQLLRKLKDSGQSISITKLLNSKHSTELTNHLESFVFSIEKKVVLIIDGVDEISPDYTKLIHSLLTQCLQATNFAKLFVATRPHMVQELQKIMEVNPFELQSFTKQNQVDFLSGYWTHKLNVITLEDKDKCKEYARVLIERMSSWTQQSYDNKEEFTTVALHLRMLAEIFQESISLNKAPTWESCKEYLKTADKKPKLPKNIEIKELYDLFLDRKRYIYVQKANPTWNSEATSGLVKQFNEFLIYHKKLALEEFLTEEYCQLFSYYQESCDDINESVLKVGIVHRSKHGFYFIHRTFAEYFVAECLVNELKLQSQNPNFKFQNLLIDRFLVLSWCYIIRAFFESFLQDVIVSIPSNVFNIYQSQSTLPDLFFFIRDSIIILLASEGCVAILQLILNCIDFHVIKGDTHFAGHFVDIFNTYSDFDRSHKKLLKTVKRNYPVNTLTVLKVLLQDTGLEIRNYEGTPLTRAAARGHLKMVRFLLDLGAKINGTDSRGSTALHLVVANGNTNIIKYLVQRGAEINCKNRNGNTPLHIAAMRRDLECFNYLIESGADITVRGVRDRTLLHFVTIGKAIVSESEFFHLRKEYYERSNRDIIKYLAKHNANINAKDEGGCTPLHYTARDGQLDTIKLLCELGGNLNIRNNKGQIALHLAAEEGHLESVKYLVSAENIDIQDNRQHTPLLLAALENHFDVVKFFQQLNAKVDFKNNVNVLHVLVESGYICDVNIKDCHGNTALHLAAKRNDIIAINLLCRMGADLKVINRIGKTALHLAAEKGQLNATQVLHNFGADLDIKDGSGRTALHLAATCNYFKLISSLISSEQYATFKYLIKEGANFNITNNQGETALHSVIASDHLYCLDEVKLLHEAGVDLNVKNIDGKTALHLAAASETLDLVKYLIEAFADLNVTDNNGETALHSAASCGNWSCVKSLVEAGADLNITDSHGRTALESAVNYRYLDVAKYLRKAGKNLTINNEDLKRRHRNCSLL